MPRHGYAWDDSHRANAIAARDARGFRHILDAVTDIRYAALTGSTRAEAKARLRYARLVLADLERNAPVMLADPFLFVAWLRLEIENRLTELAAADAGMPPGPHAPPEGHTRHGPVPSYTHHSHPHADGSGGSHSHVHEHDVGENSHHDHYHGPGLAGDQTGAQG